MDLAFEFYQRLSESVGEAKIDFPEAGDLEVELLAERALKELLADGLIYLFHHRGDSLDSAGDDESLRLSDAEALAVISDPRWRELRDNESFSSIWIGATKKGKQVMSNPPSYATRLLRQRESRLRE